MKRKKNISKLFTVGFFLSIYCNIFFTQLFCNYSHFINPSAEEHEHVEANNHHHNDEGLPSGEHSHKTHHHNDSKKEDNCCNDKTSAFFASQTNPTNISFQFKQIFPTDIIGFHQYVFVNNFPTVNPKVFFSHEYPPPKIPDIRIFIHSFLV